MNDFLQQANRTPVTFLIALAYVTLAFLTHPFEPSNEALHRFGWLTPMLAGNGEPWRMLASAFLHGGILHLGFNTLALISLGPALEQTFGSLRFALLYVVAALGGSIAVCLLYDPRSPVLGGSGALFGMMGSLLALNMRSGRHLFSFLDFEGPRRVLGLIGVNLLLGWLIPFVSNTGHVGGLVAGFLLTFVWLVPGRHPSRLLWQWRAALTALFAGLLFWSIVPSTRWDHLFLAAAAQSESEQPRWLRATAMAYSGRGEITNFEARMVLLQIDALLRGDADGAPKRPK